MRTINFFDLASSETVPTIGNIVASNLIIYADDASYEAGELGSPTRGNIYYNTTLELVRYYNGTSWISIVDESSTQTVQNKTIDGTAATGNNTVLNDATDVSYDNSTSSMVATDAQGAIDEVEGRVDTAETDISNLETLSGSPGLTAHASFTGTTIPDSSTTKEALQALETEVELKLDASEKGAANGVAELDGSGKVPVSQLPTGLMNFLGNWNATTNSPALVDGTGTSGDTYRVTVAGSQDLGSGSIAYDVGDWVYYDGTIWQRGDNVDIADTDGLAEGATNLYYTEARVSANTDVVANTAKVSASGSIDTHSDVDTSTVPPTDAQVLTWVSANSKWEPQDATGGTGQGGINYIENPDAETDTTGWAAYADAFQTTPEDGTGGSPTTTWTRSTSSPMRGTGSFLLTKAVGDTFEGEGASYDFTIDPADKAKVLQISFDYLVASGTFAAGTSSTTGDVTVWIYDVTNAQLIQPSSYKLLSNSSTIASQFNATFQTASDSTSYRLIFHLATNTSSAFTLKFDNIKVSPSTYVYGTPVTDWQSYTPTFAGLGTVSSLNAYWRRVGDSVEIQANWINGTTTATTASFTLPSGLTLDSTKINSTSVGGYYTNSSFGATVSSHLLANASTNKIEFALIVGASNGFTSIDGNNFSSSTTMSATTFRLPIQGWSSSVQTSDQTDTRVVAMRATGSSTQSITSGGGDQKITSFTTSFDTHSAFSSNTYTVIVPGIYRISALVPWSPQATSSRAYLAIYKNGSNTSTGQQIPLSASFNVTTSVTDLLNLVAGDTIEIYGNVTTTTSLTPSSYWSIERISGPSAIAASESIVAVYSDSAGQTFPATTTYNAMTFNTKEVDTHGAFNGSTGVFTAPTSGLYEANVTMGTYGTGTVAYVDLLVTPSTGTKSNSRQVGQSSSILVTNNVSKTWRLNAGDTITITKGATYSTGSVFTFNAGDWNSVSIKRVGN